MICQWHHFFCYKYVGEGKFEDVSKEDIEKEYGEYAILYRKTDDFLMNSESAADISKVIPISYQLFIRCYKRRGYFIDTIQVGDIVNYNLVVDGESAHIRKLKRRFSNLM